MSDEHGTESYLSSSHAMGCVLSHDILMQEYMGWLMLLCPFHGITVRYGCAPKGLASGHVCAEWEKRLHVCASGITGP